jgi:hypothetical protein
MCEWIEVVIVSAPGANKDELVADLFPTLHLSLSDQGSDRVLYEDQLDLLVSGPLEERVARLEHLVAQLVAGSSVEALRRLGGELPSFQHRTAMNSLIECGSVLQARLTCRGSQPVPVLTPVDIEVRLHGMEKRDVL